MAIKIQQNFVCGISDIRYDQYLFDRMTILSFAVLQSYAVDLVSISSNLSESFSVTASALH